MAYPPQDMTGTTNAWNSWNAQRRQQRQQPPQPQGDYNTWQTGQAQQRQGQQPQYGAGQPSMYQTGAEQTQGPEARYRFGQSPGYRPMYGPLAPAEMARNQGPERTAGPDLIFDRHFTVMPPLPPPPQPYGAGQPSIYQTAAEQARPQPQAQPSQPSQPSGYQSPYGQPAQPQTTSQIYQQTQYDLRTGQPTATPTPSAPQRTAVQQAVTGPDQQRTMSYQQTAAPAAQQAAQGGLPQPRSWDQFQSWVNVTYGKGFSNDDLLSVAGALGLDKDPNVFARMSPEQWGQFEQALGRMAQQRGMVPAMGLTLPTPPSTDIPTLESSIEGARQIRAGLPYQGQQEVFDLAKKVLEAPQAGTFVPTASPLEGAAQEATMGLLRSGPLVGGYAAPEAVGMADRNRILQSILTSPDVFGAQQQQQLFEQQKEQQNALAEQARQRLSQQMAQRGLSARGGAELFGQAGIEENLLSGLLGAQRDIALQSAEKNRAARTQAIQMATETAQQDAARAEAAYRTNLAGMEAARQAQERAIALGDKQAADQFARQQQVYATNVDTLNTNLQNQRQALEQLYTMQMGYSDQDRANLALAMQNQMAQRQQQMDEYNRYFSNIFDYNKWLSDAAFEAERLRQSGAMTQYNVSRPY